MASYSTGGMRPQAVHEPVGVVPMHPVGGEQLHVGQAVQGPRRNGESSRTASCSYSPMVVSANALSKASPTAPIDGTRPDAARVSPNRDRAH